MSKVINLLCRITFSNNRRIEILYRADGVKLSSEMIMDNLPDGMALKNLVPGVVAETPAADDDAAVTSKESKSLTANIIDTKTYIGNYEFTGDSLTRFKTPYGYFLHGHFYAIDYDYQGSHKESGGNYVCGVAQENRYYPYGLPIRGAGNTQYTPYLFGNKEFEDRQGLNTYDFGARNLAANAWTTPDPLAEKFYPISPYSYCGGDPINRVDRDGKEVISLRKNSKSAVGFPDNGNLIIFAHGTNQGIYDDTNDDLIKYIEETSDFVDVVNSKSVSYKDIDVSNNLKIKELMACHTGESDKSGKEPFAQKLSAELKNTIVKAPNGILSVKVKSKETKILKEDAKTGEQKEVRETPWRYFYNGVEISKSSFDFFNIVLKMERIVDEIGSEINERIKQSLQ